MICEKDLKDYVKVASSCEDLEVYVKDNGFSRSVYIKGKHTMPGIKSMCQQSEFETQLSLQTLTKIALVKGQRLRNDIERSENSKVILDRYKILLQEFGIELAQKRILDFGCSSGTTTLILMRCGATDVTGVDINDTSFNVAVSRLDDFFQSGYKFIKIENIDGQYSMPFPDGEFDIVWPHAVMEHVLPDQRRFVLEDLWRVLKIGGLLIIDATPNRLWIQEYHNTGFFFVNYLPFNIASFIARHFSWRFEVDASKETLLSRGFRGCTYWEIAKALPNSVCINNVFRKKDLSVLMQWSRRKSDSKLKRTIIDIYVVLMKLADPVFAIFGLPQTAFLPSLVIVFKKI